MHVPMIACGIVKRVRMRPCTDICMYCNGRIATDVDGMKRHVQVPRPVDIYQYYNGYGITIVRGMLPHVVRRH